MVFGLLYSSETCRLIEEQTGMTRASQLILTRNSQWTDQDRYPLSSIDNPLFIFNRENNNISFAKEYGSCKYLTLLNLP